MSTNITDSPESGIVPGRLEFAREPAYFEIPTDPDWQYFSEDPSAAIEYDLQRPLVDGSGNADDPAGDGILRDADNQLPNSHLIVHRRELAGGNDGAGIREYTVVRGAKVESAEADNNPDDEQPIGMSLTYAPRKVRSYLIHQPSAGTTLDISSTSDQDTMDITIESEGASTTDTVTVDGTTTVTSTESFDDIDAALLSAEPEGDITVADGDGTTLLEIKGGESYSDDDQPVDGDRGVPALGAGSHATAIGTTFEHFVGDRLERPAGSTVRQRVSSAGWAVENDMESNPVHDSRLPVYDEGNRTVTIDTDVAGKTTSHQNFVESLTKDQQNLEHELTNSLVSFYNTVPADIDERAVDSESGVSVYSVTFEASGDPAIAVMQP